MKFFEKALALLADLVGEEGNAFEILFLGEVDDIVNELRSVALAAEFGMNDDILNAAIAHILFSILPETYSYHIMQDIMNDRASTCCQCQTSFLSSNIEKHVGIFTALYIA